jgi:DNA-directed RNA polymerase subunit RPC12/RpoP
MDALDGNAIAGQMEQVFGVEMTTKTGTCAACGARMQMAEAVVYLQAPGTVARCPTCDSIVMVVAEVRGINCVDLMGMAAIG